MRLAPTPPDRRNTAAGRAYFVWDTDVSWEDFVGLLSSDDPEVADYWLARGLRDAKPDDMLELIALADIAAAWDRVAFRVGKQRAFWVWLLGKKGFDVAP